MPTPPYVAFSQEKLYFLLPLSQSSQSKNTLSIQNNLPHHKGAIVYKVLSTVPHRYAVSSPIGIIQEGGSLALKISLEKAAIDASIAASSSPSETSTTGDNSNAAGSASLQKSSLILDKNTKDELFFFFSPIPDGTTIETVEEATAFWKSQGSLINKSSSKSNHKRAMSKEGATKSNSIAADGNSGSKEKSNIAPPQKEKRDILHVRLPCVFVTQDELPPSVSLTPSIGSSSRNKESNKKKAKEAEGVASLRQARTVKVQTPQEEAAVAARLKWIEAKDKKKNLIKQFFSIKVPMFVAFFFLLLAFLCGWYDIDTNLSRSIAKSGSNHSGDSPQDSILPVV